ncbi:MAG: Gfo/Idh/MocA family oxidoreductase [Fimbriimonas sp.]
MRGALGGALGGLVTAGMPSWFTRESAATEAEMESQRPRKIGPNDTIYAAVIGPGGPRGGFQQGLGDTRWLSSKKGVKVIAVCDVDRAHLDNAANVFGKDTLKFSDYRELLARKDIDAVVIGTPDHWHSTISVDALNAGKDVYCEKPMTLTLAEGRDVIKAVNRKKRIFQTGSQQRSDGRFRLACELVRNGRIGKLKKVTAHLPTGPTGGPFEPQKAPADLDFNMWLGPAPQRDYLFERTHGNFRWWLDYSGGMLTDWGAHHHDISQWGIGTDDTGPISVEGTATNQPNTGVNYYSTFPTYAVTFKYANGVELLSTNEGENGVTFEGDAGWIFVSRGRIAASDPKLLEAPLGANAVRLYASNDHMQNFVDGIRTRTKTICPAEVGHRSVSVCHLANVCLRLGGGKLNWDPEKEEFIGNEMANAMRSRTPRKWS